ncbi:unnamed protein product [Candida verbasci]|uniref:DNA replication ATP-dependent helicase/nuclease DNA2 n=1 Tax=Candida verbasci TaxID=1227364 RepID=A0A9W4TYP1_9ASCO|nr:unnamed protein product [Candida verbasci]
MDDNKSFIKKKRKEDVESIKPIKKIKKQSYFTPINNLTNYNQFNNNNNHDNLKKTTPVNIKPFESVDTNTLNNKIKPVEEIPKSLVIQKNFKELNIVPDGSDDSFDGIKWKESPSNKENKYSQPNKQIDILPASSPLKNIKSNRNNLLLPENSTTTVLSKYGSNFRNVSVAITPRINKTYSDLSFTESKYKKFSSSQPSPTLQRAKSGGILHNVSDSFQNSLNTWIHKFEKDPEDQIKLQSSPVNTSNSDDPFTDDDLEIIEAMNSANLTKPKSEQVENESSDPFSDDDDDDPELLNILNKSKNTIKIEPDSDNFSKEAEESLNFLFKRSMFKRYKILNIISQNFKHNKKQLILDIVDGDEKKSKLIVRDENTLLPFNIGDIIHLIITNEHNPHLVDDSNNFLIWNPDILLSATTISQQIGCSRKTVLMSRYKFPGVYSIPLIVGEIVHFIFQECLADENWDISFMNNLADSMIDNYLLHLFSINETKEKVKEEINKHLPYLKTWFQKYYKKQLNSSNYIDQFPSKEKIMFALEEALDIEEDIKSPMFGMKGKVDATITAKFLNNNMKGKYLIPMEIKTGKEYIEHYAQASLYSLLYKDRYDLDIDSFLLVYTKEQLTKKCNIKFQDIKSLIHIRNVISQHFKSNISLPPVVKNSQCERCNVQTACMTTNLLLENGNQNDWCSDLNFNKVMQDIKDNENYSLFFSSWDKLLSQEESFLRTKNQQLWLVDPKKREGTCLENLKIVDSNDNKTSVITMTTGHGDLNGKSFLYTFEKKDSVNFLHTQFNEGDRVIVSDEDGHFAITNALIKHISKQKIIISTRRRILTHDCKLDTYKETNNQVHQGVLRKSIQAIDNKKSFRIDKDEMFYGMGLARFNLLNLFLPGGDSNTRRLVVDLDKPKFSTNTSIKTVSKLNLDQNQAIIKSCQVQDYLLIIGMPGTGKTSVIAELIKILIAQGKSILITSYTNTAVDNILIKLKKMNIDFLRIGYPLRTHPDIHEYIPGYKQEISDYFQTYMSPQIVATTCLGVTDTCFNLRNKFDYCIVDEASQISLPINLGPLRFADKFIMVGDHYQLPPLVLHQDSRVKKGLGRSLFKLLAETHPESVCELTYQYRMCDDIMQLSNILVYENKLKCGSKKVANQSLTIPKDYLTTISDGIPKSLRWMDDIIKPYNKVLFLDHDLLDAKEIQIGEAIKNPTEAFLIQQIVKTLVLSGVEEKHIGVMSYYRSQLNLLKKLLSSKTEIETLTADQYQGKDKQCIIISLVRSNDKKVAGELLKEWRRLNVAITRAKSKLIILGSRTTLSNNNVTKIFIDFIDSKGWYYKLPLNGDKLYNLPQSVNSSPIKSQKRESRIMKNKVVLKNIIDELNT